MRSRVVETDEEDARGREQDSSLNSDAEDMPRWRLLMMTIAMCGIQVCYAVQVGHGSAALELLGMPTQLVSIAWLAGPLSGMIVQPIIGVLSDACTSPLGRRRPFILAGCALTTLALLLFSNASPLGRLLGDGRDVDEGINVDARGASSPRGLVFGVIGFFFLDFSIQAIQGPLRALLTDIVPQHQHAQGNAYFALMVGAGNLLGSWLGSLDLERALHIPLAWRIDDTQILFALAAIILCITVALCVTFSVERPHIIALPAPPRTPMTRANGVENGSSSVNAPHDEEKEDGSSEMGVLELLRNAPRPFWSVFTVQAFSWYGFFTIFVYASVWVGRNVFLGESSALADSASRDLYADGVRLGNVGLSISAAVTIVYATQLPWLINRLGVRAMFLVSLLVQAASLCSCLFIRGSPPQTQPSKGLKAATLISLGSLGVSWASTMTIPWSMIGESVQRVYPSRAGLFTTLFNMSQSGPQLLVSFGSPLILRITHDVSAVMFSGGLMALIGAAMVILLRVGDPSVLYDERVSTTETSST
eukprot:CAMPEP_0185850980 /NCGR_PEP_ID=MMETSP1354-20130828/4894_1 /TAXON_ID=708628 /ORGANISM="Erythrolobus madagascarensis, Strain CCMP3276" /LENGTH=533 /DNA_ID=CAMNT_0028551715 /DNA_START=213 /DNA_END=1814 /DNA_ORIENTATION=-